jgi:hypothetical protein
MKKQIIASLSVLLGVLIVAMLSSCATSGYNYSAHSRKNKSVMSKAHKRNAGRDMVNYRCTNKH